MIFNIPLTIGPYQLLVVDIQAGKIDNLRYEIRVIIDKIILSLKNDNIFMDDNKEYNKYGTGHSYRQPSHIDQGKNSVLTDVPYGNNKEVPPHDTPIAPSKTVSMPQSLTHC